MDYDFDLFVIGGGSAGVRTARLAAQKGLRVGLAEADRMGGTCVIRGCVPKKLMLYAATFKDTFEVATSFGWDVGTKHFDYSLFYGKLTQELARLENVYDTLLKNSGVQVFRDWASLVTPNQIALGAGQKITAERIILATGAHPFVPDFDGAAHVLTSDDIFLQPTRPASMVIVGGGYIALEFAGIFQRLGTQVTLVYRGDLPLRGYDLEIRHILIDEMKKTGLHLHLNTDIQKITHDGEQKHIALNNGETLEANVVLYATGRQPNVANLGLENVGVRLENGYIHVDAYSKTSVENIYALGDVTGRTGLTPVAIREAVNFIKTVYDNDPQKIDYTQIPTAIFTRPEFGTIGLSEEAAHELGHTTQIYFTKFNAMATSFSENKQPMVMKLVVSTETDRVLGVHILGEGAAEMIQMTAIPMAMGAKKSDFDRAIAVHPTAAEELVTMRTPRA